MAEVKDIIEKVLKQTIGEKGYRNDMKKKYAPVREHKLSYNSTAETLEPVYFWILDLMNNFFGGKVEKLVDNFTASPGGGYFAEMGQRKSIMQKNVSDTLATVGVVTKSIINIIYDLREFEIRLEHYTRAKSENKKDGESGLLALKEIWMNNVDMKRGVGSINSLSQQLNFITLRDAFMAVNSLKDVENLDLNERVKRILKSRVAEFLDWKDLSEKELRKRFEIQKNYLRSQVNMLQLYSRWVKPYLKTAAKLEMKEEGRSPEIISSFNTIVLELAIFGKNKVNVEEEKAKRTLPKNLKEPKKGYYSVVLVEFHFRGIPYKMGQHYVFGGKVDVSFQAYGLSEDELNALETELKKSDIEDVFKLIEGSTTESLDRLKEDIDYFLEGKKPEEKEEEKEKPEDTNPFSALFGDIKKFFKKEEKKDEKDKTLKIEDLKKDTYQEEEVRKIAADAASNTCFTLFDVYKKAHGMASHDNPFE